MVLTLKTLYGIESAFLQSIISLNVTISFDRSHHRVIFLSYIGFSL